MDGDSAGVRVIVDLILGERELRCPTCSAYLLVEGELRLNQSLHLLFGWLMSAVAHVQREGEVFQEGVGPSFSIFAFRLAVTGYIRGCECPGDIVYRFTAIRIL